MGLKEFVQECRRVLKVTRKPSKKEYFTIVKISGIGMLIIGLMGFVVYLVAQMFK